MGNWYSARLLYECVVDDDMPDAEHTWEETTIIFQCGDDENMESKLANLAKKAEVRSDNVYGNPVKWTFRELLEVQEISGHELADGTEVFFRFWTSPDAKDFEFLRRTHTEPWWPQVNLEE